MEFVIAQNQTNENHIAKEGEREKNSLLVLNEFMGISKNMKKVLLILLGQVDGKGQVRMTPYILRKRLLGEYERVGRRQEKRLFLLDYNGMLVPIIKTSPMAVPSASTLEALEQLSADLKNIVYIISGRDGAFLKQHLGHLRNVKFRVLAHMLM
ncbi:hypothetical protein C0995_014369 [Termitomyces sp. Mi166|nr:hypothetical protein C0995_014369 [Termitomyces sp. Mi166\